MKKTRMLFFIGLLLFSLTGCSNSKEQELRMDDVEKSMNHVLEEVYRLNVELEDAKQQIKTLEDEAKVMDENYTALVEDIENTNAEYDQMLEYVQLNEGAYISVFENGYDAAETDLGSLTFSVDTVEEYLSGYQIDLTIGNPNYVDLVGLDLLVYGLGPEFQTISEEINIELSDTIYAGSWNTVTITIPYVSSNKLSYLYIEAETNTISMK